MCGEAAGRTRGQGSTVALSGPRGLFLCTPLFTSALNTPPHERSLCCCSVILSWQLLLEEAVPSSALSQEVSGLVEMIWAEALGRLEHTLLKPVNRMSLNDVSRVSWKLEVLPGRVRRGSRRLRVCGGLGLGAPGRPPGAQTLVCLTVT